jgi:hypothetical protein
MMVNNSIFDKIDAFTQIYRDARQQYDTEAEQYWEALSYEDKLKVFYLVTKRIHKGDVIDRGSFRYVLYDTFGFDMDSYLVGMDSGYMEIHNAIAEGLSND